MAIRIGCGSWADAAYVGLLYPPGTPAAQRLGMYARWFDRVELNNTYYATPSAGRMAGWARQTPPGFGFDFKLHRAFAQHPATGGELVAKLRASVQPLLARKQLGCFLLTLAPSFGPDRHRLEELEALRENLPPGVPLAVELRDRAWVEGRQRTATLGFFRERSLAWVALDLPPVRHQAVLPVIDEVTDPRLAYVRLHGRNPDYARGRTAAEKHHYEYREKELLEIAARLRRLADQAEEVHVSVNNHAEDFAPKAALALRRLLDQEIEGVPMGPPPKQRSLGRTE